MSDDFDAAARQGTVLALWAARRPDAPAILSPHGDRTFAELDANANRLVRAWRERGVGAGDAVLIPAGAWHGIIAGPEGARFLCCCAPPYSDDDTFFA